MWKNRKKKIRHDEDDFLTVSEVNSKNTDKTKPIKPIDDTEEERELDIKKIVCCIIILILLILIPVFYFVNTGFIGDFKKNISITFNSISESFGFSSSDKSDTTMQLSNANVWNGIEGSLDQDSKMIPFENASLSSISVGNKGLVVAKSNYISVFNNEGSSVWNTQTSVIDPILRTEGDYILLAEKDGKRICLFQNEKLLFSVDSPNEILTAGMSSNGDIVLVTKKEFYKNAVLVYNKNGEQVFSWSSGTDTIINADISSSRKIAISLINTDERVKSYVMFFDINKSEPYHNVEFTESIVFKTQFIGDTLNSTADNRLTGINTNGNVLWDIVYTTGTLLLSSVDSSGNKATVLEKDNLPQLITYGQDDKQNENINLDSLPDYLDIKNSSLLYNSERIVNFGTPKKLEKFIASMDIKGLKILNDKSFVIIYNNSLEFVSK